MRSSSQVRVYTDGSCAFCLWARQVVEPRDLNLKIDFRDFNDPAIASETPFSRPQLLEEMHVLTIDGRWHAGFSGWLVILRELPRWRWLATLLSLPPMRWIGPPLYRFLARNRHRMPRWLLSLIGAPQPCGTECEVPSGP